MTSLVIYAFVVH